MTTLKRWPYAQDHNRRATIDNMREIRKRVERALAIVALAETQGLPSELEAEARLLIAEVGYYAADTQVRMVEAKQGAD
jgi:hypothetical protein